ncbi:MAG: hypothetical protein IT381_19000 [Deltaproteobacteria bacterium]|nr:hypothetical protein [Deltaproteobacteria bacterium]
MSSGETYMWASTMAAGVRTCTGGMLQHHFQKLNKATFAMDKMASENLQRLIDEDQKKR